jgi:hypothetical protein
VVREKVCITRSYIREPGENEENKAEAEHQSPPPVAMILSKNKDPVVFTESFDLESPHSQRTAYMLLGVLYMLEES